MHEYMKRLKAGKECGDVDTGTLSCIEIDHAPQCRVHEPGFCDCDVSIKIVQFKDRHFYIKPNGRLVPC